MMMRLPPTPTMNSRISLLPNDLRLRAASAAPLFPIFIDKTGPRAGLFRIRTTTMTNPLSTPEPAVYGAAFDQKQRDYALRAKEIRAANKTVLFDLLASAGIETLPVLFDGYGDSGKIERVDIEAP